MSETHSLRLSIDAAAAQAGSKQFTAAIDAVRKAVSGLERDTSGAFTALTKTPANGLKSVATDANSASRAISGTEAAASRAARQLVQTSLAAATAARTSVNEFARLESRLTALGANDSVDRLVADMARLKAGLAAANTPLDVRVARSSWADSANEARRYAGSLGEVQAAENAAAIAAEKHATEIDRLRSKLVPLYSASKQYESALEEVARAEAMGAITAGQAAAARERAAAGLLAASAANDQFAASTGRVNAASLNVMYNLQDVGVMMAAGQNPMTLALQQGLQIAGALEASGAKGVKVFGLLKSAALSLVSPLSLLTVGIIFFSATAVQAGTALYAAFADGPGKILATKDALDALGTSTTAAANAARRVSDFTALRSEFGSLTAAVRELIAAQNELAQMDAVKDLATLRASLYEDVAGVGALDSLAGYADTAQGRVRKIRDELDLTTKSAQTLETLFQTSRGIESATTLASIYRQLRVELIAATGGVQNMNSAQLEVLRKLTNSEAAARKLAAAQDGTAGATKRASSAASGLTASIGTAADEASRLLSLLSSVPGALAVMGRSVAGQIEGIRAQNRALNLELSEGLSSAAASRRVQLETMVSTASSRGQRLNFDSIASQAAAIKELDAASKEQDRLRGAISERNKPASGGGGRAAAISEEARALEDLNGKLADRLTALQAEKLGLELVSSGQFKTVEGANLMAEAMIASGNGVDANTLAMIRSIDAAAALNEQLSALAKDPVREWMNSVPTWIKAGQQIEIGAIGHVKNALSEFIKTGKLDFESLGDAILGTVADIVADKAMAELATFLGRGNGEGLGVLGGLFRSVGDPVAPESTAMVTASATAGSNISSAMISAGQTVSQSIASAMTSAGTSAGASVRTGATTGLAIGSNNIRTASVTAGSTLGQGVVTGANSAAPILAAGVAGGAGGGGGGGFLSSLGGVGGLLSMALGAFSEGGYSDRPVSMTSAPVNAFRNAPHFAEGGVTSGGIPAILHKNEAVVPLSRGRKLPVDLGDAAGGTIINQAQTFNITTPDADSFRRSQKQILSDAGSQTSRAMRSNG